MELQPIRVKQIDHVSLVIADLDASRHFYHAVLGMEIVPRPDFDFDGLWLQAGSTLIHLIVEHEKSGPAGNRMASGTQPGRTWHLAFEVDDAILAHALLEQWGMKAVSGPKVRPDGAVQVVVLDPDGYVVELFHLRQM
ncbi:VOC family protein [Planctomicrobium sp. SH668]|uniref:VOC family protein n=1 Tax=Planctomicrobium sp. SH668 TaxID=3448126 RepID=UPI003F5C920E